MYEGYMPLVLDGLSRWSRRHPQGCARVGVDAEGRVASTTTNPPVDRSPAAPSRPSAPVAHRDEQRERHNGVVGEARGSVGPQEKTVAPQILEEEQGPDALVAVAERVVLYDEVEDVGGALLGARVQRVASERLLNRAE